MSYRTRKLLCVLVLFIGLPAYVVVAMWVVSLFGRPSFLVELAVYVGLGVLWALPLKALFRGMGRAGPGQEEPPRLR
ncbi:MAG TPA: DUF2842 domain-containing protein [Paracoccaceae bacterium]|nr:DUF2842 domain-containing protein [Paracoccaceae bacterium]